jgi:hypothetical protein
LAGIVAKGVGKSIPYRDIAYVAAAQIDSKIGWASPKSAVCDIRNYTTQLPLSLSDPVLTLGYKFCKGFYPRVQEQLYGRATRLFVIPFLRALVRATGDFPLFDFIDSFRYPLGWRMCIHD